MTRIARTLVLGALLAGCAGMPDLSGVLSSSADTRAGLSDSDITAGLKDALSTATRRAILRTGVTDGFWLNRDINIPLPEQLQKAERTLRALGQGKTVDDFHLSLNRAAEAAVPEAAQVFEMQIRQMTIADARAILDGPPTAATDYFRRTTSDILTQRFRPIVARTTSQVGVTKRYKDLAGRVEALVPGFQMQDIDAYVTDRALSGLFRTIGDEEMRIRRDPAARTSEILKKVFGAP